MKCPKCGRSSSIWTIGLGTGICHTCREAEAKAQYEAECQKRQAQQAQETESRKEEERQRLPSRLQSQIHELQQKHLARIAAIKALDSIDSSIREKLIEEDLRQYHEVLPAVLNGRITLPSPSVWNVIGTCCFFLCAILLFVACERYVSNSSKVEAANKLMQSSQLGKPSQLGKLEAGIPTPTTYAMFFALLSCIGGGVCLNLANTERSGNFYYGVLPHA